MSQKHVEDLERANLDKLASALRVARETEEIASVTSTTLHSQTEQLHRIQHKQDQVQSNIQKSSRIVTSMESIFGKVKNLFTKKPKDPPPMPAPSTDPRNPDYTGKTSPKSQVKPPVEEGKREEVPAADRPGRKLLSQRYLEQEDQMLGEIDDSVSALRTMAKNMGDTLDYHNELLDGITVKNDKNTQDMAALQKRTTKLLR